MGGGRSIQIVTGGISKYQRIIFIKQTITFIRYFILASMLGPNRFSGRA